MLPGNFLTGEPCNFWHQVTWLLKVCLLWHLTGTNLWRYQLHKFHFQGDRKLTANTAWRWGKPKVIMSGGFLLFGVQHTVSNSVELHSMYTQLNWEKPSTSENSRAERARVWVQQGSSPTPINHARDAQTQHLPLDTLLLGVGQGWRMDRAYRALC
jgi:hypothetical protein